MEKWSSNDVGSWLAECGVSPEGIAVCTETVGGAVLADLTRQELEEIGVRATDRLKIMQGVSKLPRHPSSELIKLINPIVEADKKAFDADYNAAFQSRLLAERHRGPSAASQRHSCAVSGEQSSGERCELTEEDSVAVRVVDVCRSHHKFSHITFTRILQTKKLLSLPLGDGCTAAFSMSGSDARSIQKQLLSNEARIRRSAEQELQDTFLDPKVIVEEFPALHYLGLKQMKKVPSALTAAHKQRLVDYGEGVLRCLTTEVQSELEDLKPHFKHHLTCDLVVTGLPRAYTRRFSAAVEQMEARLEEEKSPDKEHDSVYAIMSLPRMGKSLLLQDLARRLESKGKRVACITYTGWDLICDDDTASVAGAISGFCIRLLRACVFPAQLHSNMHVKLVESLRTRSIRVGDFKATLRKLGLDIPEVVFVDEFTKLLDEFSEDDQRAIMKGIIQLSCTSKLVFSGFVTSATPKLTSTSGRSVETHFFELPPVSAECLEDFRVRLAPHRALMMETSPLLYLSCQNSPGLLGHLFETMTKSSVPLPPLYTTESKREQLVEWLRDLTTKELRGGGTDPRQFVDAQRAAVALVVNKNTTVAHPFAFATVLGSRNETLSSSCSGGAVLENLPHQRALLIDLVQKLSVLSRTVHDTREELVRTDDKDEVLEAKLRATKCEYLEVATYHARALRMLAKYQHSGNVELDPQCDLRTEARQGPNESRRSEAAANGESSDETDRASVVDRITAVAAGLDSLQGRNIHGFVWRLKANGEAVAGVVEGEFADGRWSITFTEVKCDRKLQYVRDRMTGPSPFGDSGRIASVELVFLCPGATTGNKENAPRPDQQDAVENTKIGVASKHPFKTRILADSVGVRQHLSTPIASLLTGQFQGHED